MSRNVLFDLSLRIIGVAHKVRPTLLVFIAFSLAVSACIQAIQAQSPDPAQPASSDPTSLPATEVSIETNQPAAEPTQEPLPTLTKVPVILGTFEDSVLVTEWNNGRREHRLYPLDPESGQALPGYPPISLGENYFYTFTPDRRTLAVAAPGSLRLIDLANWEERAFDLQLATRHATGMAIDPEGRRLAIVSGQRESQVTIFDLEEQAITAQSSLEVLFPRLKITADGKGLMVYGAKVQNRFTANERSAGPPIVYLLDTGDLRVRWSAELEGVRDGIYPKDQKAGEKVDISQPDSAIYLLPALVLAPDRDALYVVHAGEEKFTTVDFNIQSVETLEIQTPLSWLERLLALTAGVARAKVAEGTSQRAVISPDGQFLYVLGMENSVLQDDKGEWQMVSNPLGLEVVRTADGSRIERIDTQANEISISPDGRFLYLGSWDDARPWTDLFDTSEMRVVARMDGLLSPVFRMNGEMLLAASDWINETRNHMTLVDPEILEVLVEWTGPYAAWLGAP